MLKMLRLMQMILQKWQIFAKSKIFPWWLWAQNSRLWTASLIISKSVA